MHTPIVVGAAKWRDLLNVQAHCQNPDCNHAGPVCTSAPIAPALRPTHDDHDACWQATVNFLCTARKDDKPCPSRVSRQVCAQGHA